MNARTTFPAYDTHRRRAIQMRAVAVGVAARWPARQPVEGVVAEGLGVAGARDGVGAHDSATGASGALGGTRPGEAVVFVVAAKSANGESGGMATAQRLAVLTW